MNELEKLRSEIDFLDNELLKILGERFSVTRKIGDIKKRNNYASTDEFRLSQIMQSWKHKAVENKINAELIESILLSIHTFVVKEHEVITST